jgi:hypothetical protein
MHHVPVQCVISVLELFSYYRHNINANYTTTLHAQHPPQAFYAFFAFMLYILDILRPTSPPNLEALGFVIC